MTAKRYGVVYKITNTVNGKVYVGQTRNKLADRWREHQKRTDCQKLYAAIGDPPPSSTLDRIDNDRSYEPGNVRWATRKQQLLNRRTTRLHTYKGEALTLIDWSRKLHVPKSTLTSRLAMGWPIARVLSQPTNKYKRRTK